MKRWPTTAQCDETTPAVVAAPAAVARQRCDAIGRSRRERSWRRSAAGDRCRAVRRIRPRRAVRRQCVTDAARAGQRRRAAKSGPLGFWARRCALRSRFEQPASRRCGFTSSCRPDTPVGEATRACGCGSMPSDGAKLLAHAKVNLTQPGVFSSNGGTRFGQSEETVVAASYEEPAAPPAPSTDVATTSMTEGDWAIAEPGKPANLPAEASMTPAKRLASVERTDSAGDGERCRGSRRAKRRQQAARAKSRPRSRRRHRNRLPRIRPSSGRDGRLSGPATSGESRGDAAELVGDAVDCAEPQRCVERCQTLSAGALTYTRRHGRRRDSNRRRHLPCRLNVADRLAEIARQMPDAIAVACPRRWSPSYRSVRQGESGAVYATTTFAELDADATRIARGLVAWGVPPGTRLALLVRPGIEFVTLVFALLRAGMVIVLVDPGLGRRNLIRCLAEAEPEGFVAIGMAQAARRVVAAQVSAGAVERDGRPAVVLGRADARAIACSGDSVGWALPTNDRISNGGRCPPYAGRRSGGDHFYVRQHGAAEGRAVHAADVRYAGERDSIDVRHRAGRRRSGVLSAVRAVQLGDGRDDRAAGDGFLAAGGGRSAKSCWRRRTIGR